MPEDWLQQTLAIWRAGGYLMVPLALLALFIYYTSMELYLYFSRSGLQRPEEAVWGPWVRDPAAAEGAVGGIIRYALAGSPAAQAIRSRFTEIRAAQFDRIDRRLRFLSVLVAAAPLTGLLGTVVGMLATFRALASAAGGATTDLVAAGISQALITTQTGLLIAIPGYVFIHLIRRRRVELEYFITHLESTVLQSRARERKETV